MIKTMVKKSIRKDAVTSETELALSVLFAERINISISNVKIANIIDPLYAYSRFQDKTSEAMLLLYGYHIQLL